MRYLTLFTDETSWLALDGKVIPAADVASVDTAAELAQSMSERLQQANDDIEQRKQTAQASGYEAGYEAGLKAAALHNDQAVNTLQQAYKKQTQEQEAQVVALAMAVVKRIAGEVDSDAWLSAQALQAVASLRNPDESVRLLVHASQVDSVRARINALKETPDPQAIRIDSVEAGEDNDVDQCRLEVAVGSTVLVDLHTQINAIERALNTADTQAVAHG